MMSLFCAVLIAALVVCASTWLKFYNRSRSRGVHIDYEYDAIVVGCSIAGPVIAKALSLQGRKVLVVERALFTRPDRIVGELLQPGGIDALKEVDMEECVVSVGMTCKGYVVVDTDGHTVDLPYGGSVQGMSFHFGDFVQKLRAHVYQNCASNVTMVEGNVTRILTRKVSSLVERAYGIEYAMEERYTVPTEPFVVDPPRSCTSSARVTKTATAPLIIMCDGGSSRWKGRYQHYTPATTNHSHFVGLIVKSVKLPVEQRGTVFFGKTGPILSYRLDPNELRFLVDYNKPALPNLAQQSQWLVRDVAPCLPKHMQEEFIRAASDTANIRSMPLAFYPPTFPAIRGYVGLGDHGNQRHPLTGGGMTCAFRDALLLARSVKALKAMRSGDHDEMERIDEELHRAVVQYTRRRYAHSCCINLLSWALYDVFNTRLLRNACFDYFSCGGDFVQGPINLLAGLDMSVVSLVCRYYRVMYYEVWCIMTQTSLYNRDKDKQLAEASVLRSLAKFFADPNRIGQALYILVVSTLFVLPIGMNEFVSMWRLIDPTSTVAVVSKYIKHTIYTNMYKSSSLRPVGL